MYSTSSLMYLDAKYLNELAIKYRDAYSQAEPFAHIVIDNFLPESFLERILTEFPKVNSIEWQQFNNTAEKKLASKAELQMGEMTRFLFYQLNSSVFLKFLETITGISGLIPDPYFEGGGLHQIQRGGYLKMHVDFNRHVKLKLDRRLNVLIYLNKNWEEEYGGHLQLWDKDMTQCHKKILPIFNRCVIFTTTESSYHGHPDPLTCPEGETRKSLALYYYTNEQSEEPIDNTHSTIFQPRPGEEIIEESPSALTVTKNILKKLVPPIVIDAKNYLMKR